VFSVLKRAAPVVCWWRSVVALSEFDLIKNRATIVKCELPWTGTCSGGVDVGKERALPL